MLNDEQIDHRTQEIVKLQIGDLVLTAARRLAEVETLRAEIARLTLPSSEPPSDAP